MRSPLPVGVMTRLMVALIPIDVEPIRVQRVRAGIAKARAQGTRKREGHRTPKVPAEKIGAIRAALAAGNGIKKAA